MPFKFSDFQAGDVIRTDEDTYQVYGKGRTWLYAWNSSDKAWHVHPENVREIICVADGKRKIGF